MARKAHSTLSFKCMKLKALLFENVDRKQQVCFVDQLKQHGRTLSTLK
jgi:hypothetical protein